MAQLCGWLNYVNGDAVIGAAALYCAILLPLVLFAIEQNDDAFGFDRRILINKIFNYKWLMGSFIVFAILSIFSKYGSDQKNKYNCIFAFLSLIAFFVLSFYVIKALFLVYRWINDLNHKGLESFRHGERIKFLKDLQDSESYEIWSNIFGDKRLLEKNQRGLIEEYLDWCNEYYKKNKLKWGALSILIKNIEKVDFLVKASDNEKLVDDLLIEYSLEYYIEKRQNSLCIIREKHDLLMRIMKLSVISEHKIWPLEESFFFIAIKEFVEKVNSEGKDQEIIDDLHNDIAKELINNAISNDKFKISWSEFDGSIVINEKNIYKRNGIIKAYFDCIINEILPYNDINAPYNKIMTIDSITRSFFGDVNCILWFDTITLALGYFDSGGYTRWIESWLSHKHLYGVTNGVLIDYTNNIDERKKRMKDAFNKKDKNTLSILSNIANVSQIFNNEEIEKIKNTLSDIKKNSDDKDKMYKYKIDRIEDSLNKINSFNSEILSK